MQIDTAATYGTYGPVTILATDGALSQIRTNNEQEFWVRTEKLKPTKLRLSACPTVIVCDAPSVWKDFAAYLMANGFRLSVSCRPDGVEMAQAEYERWSGETLPESCIRQYDNKPVAREWILTFALGGDIVCPFPIEVMGTTGRKPTQRPRGLFRTAQRVEVCFAVIVEHLVLAGLRAESGLPN